jgi:hypothetical protein
MRLFYLQLDTLYVKFQYVLHTEQNALPLIKNKTGNVRINVTLRCVRVNIITVERHKFYIFSVCICSRSYQACAVTHCHLCDLWQYHIFPRFLVKVTIFQKL